MTERRRHILTFARTVAAVVGLWLALPSAAQTAPDDDDGSQSDLRENPELEGNVSATDEPAPANYSRFPFINTAKNIIHLNGSDWSGLARRFAALEHEAEPNEGLEHHGHHAGTRRVSVVHIGDSHIQADGASGRARRLLQGRYGDAGRGLMIPFRLAGTNQPLDYTITSPTRLTAAKLLKQPWPAEMGFTGIALQPSGYSSCFDLTLKPDHSHIYEASTLTVFFSGSPAEVTYIESDGEKVAYTVTESAPDHVAVSLARPVDRLSVHLRGGDDTAVHGFSTANGRDGVIYHAIGNNGATYSSYNTVGSVGRDVKALRPDLIIVSLGTNEAFGRMSSDVFYSHIHNLVRDLRSNNPGAEIMLVTPSECQRRITTTRRRRRRRARRVTTYQTNVNIPRLRDVIMRYGRDNGVAVYDWYEVAGGAGSSAKWMKAGLMSRDRIHNTWSGYELQGDLMYDAIVNTLSNSAPRTSD